jgi:hypothetical protein
LGEGRWRRCTPPSSVCGGCSIGADGVLAGYVGGIERKRGLLRHEGALTYRPPHLLPLTPSHAGEGENYREGQRPFVPAALG